LNIIYSLLIALAITLAWNIPTVLSYKLTRKKDFAVVMGAALGIWFLKLVLVSLGIYLIKDFDFYDHTWLLGFVGIFILASFGGEALYFWRRLKEPTN
jgi:drug/metabolite transporter (DMT)-like permease